MAQSDEPAVAESERKRALVLWASGTTEPGECDPLRRHVDVLWVPGNDAALAAARVHLPDLVVSDLTLARLDGFRLLRELRADPTIGAIPILLIGARGGEEVGIDSLAAGADDFLTAPFSTRDLISRVETQVRVARFRREAGAAVRESESHSQRVDALLAAIVDSSDDAIISKNLEGIITSWNASAERIFGYSPAEAVGRSITMLIPPDRLDEEPRILERLKRGERVDHFETVRARKDGSTLHISLTISPIKDRDGRIVGASKVARDISERMRADAELREQRAIVDQLYDTEQGLRKEAEAASRAKDEFLAMLGHELRNPLAAISNASIAAEMDPSYAERALGVVRRSVGQLTRLVDDLLDVARITQGKIALRRRRIDLGDVVQRAVEATRPVIEERKHRLTISLPRGVVEIDGDEIRIEQVVVNLVANAAKFTPPGGNVRVAVERDAGFAVLRVVDDGVGLAPELLPRIFDPFAQGDADLARTPGGLGIGLTIVRRIVELHGGRVEATSEGPGSGAEFVVRLPELAPRERSAAKPRVAVPNPKRCQRVLLVEDNRDAADSMATLLERLGHDVEVVHDGASAIERLGTFGPELMLVDIGLPGMDGYEVARRLRLESGRADLVLVALTGYGGPEHRRRAIEAGFDHHLTKPVDLRTLRAIAERLG